MPNYVCHFIFFSFLFNLLLTKNAVPLLRIPTNRFISTILKDKQINKMKHFLRHFYNLFTLSSFRKKRYQARRRSMNYGYRLLCAEYSYRRNQP